jgi:sterol desaturase/sphingolipid hydroxylase (fatty acid hydroxylase superfamily)
MTFAGPEETITGGRRKSVPMSAAWREFWRYPSPRIMATLLLTACACRLVAGGWRVSDAAVPVVAIAAFPFLEWIVHTGVLHWRPRRIGRVTIDPLLARKHRLHHADPRDVALVFIPWKALVWIVPTDTAIALFAFPRIATGLTFLVTVAALGLGYEWSHYLIHTDYRPKSRIFRAVWRNHRLHHYKNEHYWFTVTTSGTADRILRTYPDPAAVPASPTARALHAGAAN